MTFISPPSPPTDNLYKFVAISGLLLLVGAPVYWATFEVKLQERQTEAWVSLFKRIQVPGEYLVPPRFESTPEGNRAREEWQALRDSIDSQEAEHFRITAQLRDLERVERLVSVVALLAAVLGLIFASLGFRFWYVRVQVLQDQLLKKQLAEAGTNKAA